MASQALGPQVPPKPFKVSKWLMGSFLLFLIGYFILSFVQHRISAAGALTDNKGTQQAPPSAPASPADIDGFSRTQSQKLLDLAKKRALMSKEIEAAGLGQVEIVDIVNQLPACNKSERDSLRGQTYVAVNQKTHQLVQFACETDDSWHPLPVAANNIPLPTPQQNDAMHSTRRSGDGMTAKERKAAALQKALGSPAVVDFALPQQIPAATPVFPTTNQTMPASLVPVVDRPDESPAEAQRRKEKYPWNSYTGKLYHLFAGIPIGAILTNRLSGEFTGPVNLMLTTDVYSLDRQHVLIPQGTRVLGEARRVDVSGQRRLVVLLHRLIMDDGYSVDLENALGLDQVGASGLTGRVNSHWAKVILTAGAIGALGGLSEIGVSTATLTGVGAMRLGVTQQTGQSATQILDRALNLLPTITVYEGSPVVVYIQVDLDLPARENHTISANL